MVVSEEFASILFIVKTIAWAIFCFCIFFYINNTKPKRVLIAQTISSFIIFGYHVFSVISGIDASTISKICAICFGLSTILYADILRKMPNKKEKDPE